MNFPGRLVVALFLQTLVAAQTASENAARLVNLSVRTNAGTGADTLIVGFSLAGSGNKPLLIRGIGPTLGAFGVSGSLADPTLRLDVLNGALVAQNDNWEPALAATSASVGAFPLPAGSRDAALLQILAPGTYTAQLGGGSGVALVEVYDAAASSAARLVNVSARTRSGAGSDVLIAGFAIAGTGSKTLLIRGVGPGLAPFGVGGTLADPQLAVYAGTSLIAANDNWGGTGALGTAFAQVGAFALPSGSRDAAMLVTLPPGNYTAQVGGAGNTTGIVLVEVYEAADGTPPQVTPVLDLFATEGTFPARLFRVSPATGATASLGATSFFPGLEFRRNGVLYGSSGTLGIVSLQNGSSTNVGTLPELIVGITFSPDDALFGVSNSGQTLYRIDPATGRALSSVPLTGTTHPSGAIFSGEIDAIEFASDGTLYGIGFSLYTINPNTGVARKVSTAGSLVSGQLYGSLDFGPDGVLRAGTAAVDVGSASELHTVDLRSGVASVVGSTGIKIGGLASRAVGTSAVAVQTGGVPPTATLAARASESSELATFQEIIRARLDRIRAVQEDRGPAQR